MSLRSVLAIVAGCVVMLVGFYFFRYTLEINIGFLMMLAGLIWVAFCVVPVGHDAYTESRRRPVVPSQFSFANPPPKHFMMVDEPEEEKENNGPSNED
jgi:hypothetical protein